MLADAVFILPADVIVIPVAQLAPDVARRTRARPDDIAITRPLGRTPSCIVDKMFAAFVQEFRSPKKIAVAIVDFGRRNSLDRDLLLNDALPVLARLINARFLVPADGSVRISRTVSQAGDLIGSLRVLAAVSVMDDTEVYQVRCDDGTVGALKIAAEGSAQSLLQSFRREAAVLAWLDGRVNPRLLATGTVEDRPYLLMGWSTGEPLSSVAARARTFEPPAVLRDLALRVLEAFAHLHHHGIVHGDVHPENVLCARQEAITIVDFALAASEGLPPASAPRGGVGFFFEPEFIRSHGRGAATARGEQYALAALLFRVFTGEDYLDFSLERDVAFGQIIEEAPRPFAQCGAPPWPAVEAILRRALEKDPARRFASVAQFARELAAAAPVARKHVRERGRIVDVRRYIDEAMTSIGIGSRLAGTGVPDAPRASVTLGAAGIALACLRIAYVRDDPALLALAEFWSDRALTDSATDDGGAFRSEELGIHPRTVGNISPYHTASGVHAVRLLIAAAGGDAVAVATERDSFITEAQTGCERLDVTLGTSGILVVAAILLEAIGHRVDVGAMPLLELGDRVSRELWSRLDDDDEIGADGGIAALGIAHGWAGFLYAGLTWSRVAHHPLPPAALRRLTELAALREPCGSGSRWRVAHPGNGPVRFTSGWCNGSAGLVFTWTAAFAALGDGRFLERAEEAGWNAWESSPGASNLCCGDAGRAYALLNLYRATGDACWLRRAEQLTYRAIDAAGGIASARSGRGESLYKGALGIAVLAADLADPGRARMPFFEHDGLGVAVGGEHR